MRFLGSSLVIASSLLAVGCTGAGEPPSITSITPASGGVGTEVTITGTNLADDNDVGFALPDNANWEAAFENGVASADGETVTFVIPELMGACAMTQIEDDEECPLIGLSPPEGTTDVFVATEAGDSNTLEFTFEAE